MSRVSLIDEADAFGGALVCEDGKILLREPKGHYGGYVWTFPRAARRRARAPGRRRYGKSKRKPSRFFPPGIEYNLEGTSNGLCQSGQSSRTT